MIPTFYHHCGGLCLYLNYKTSTPSFAFISDGFLFPDDSSTHSLIGLLVCLFLTKQARQNY